MPMIRRSLLFLLVFIVVGEGVVRFDEHTLLFQGSRFETIAEVYKKSMEKELADRGQFPHNASDLRVMLLGDSALYGAGIPAEHAAGVRLKAKLRSSLKSDHVYVLDVTRPANNTFQNREAFEQYLDSFAPQIVILAYNHNDVYGDQGMKRLNTTKSAVEEVRRVTATDRVMNAVVEARRLLFKSRLVSFALVKINMELKLAGVVIPGTEFDHLLNRSHAPDYAGWVDSQKHLAEMAAICRSRDIQLIVYIVPELEMLSRYSLFDPLDHYLGDYFSKLRVVSVNGVDAFRKRKGHDFALSRYDGHPNDEAHDIMASDLRDAVLKALDRDRVTGTQNKVKCPHPN